MLGDKIVTSYPHRFILDVFLIQGLDILFEFLGLLYKTDTVMKVSLKSLHHSFNITYLKLNEKKTQSANTDERVNQQRNSTQQVTQSKLKTFLTLCLSICISLSVALSFSLSSVMFNSRLVFCLWNRSSSLSICWKGKCKARLNLFSSLWPTLQKSLFRFRGKNMLSIVRYGKISSFYPTFC